jgi:hypothetical protein
VLQWDFHHRIQSGGNPIDEAKDRTGAAADGTACDTTVGPGCLDLSRCIVGADGGTAGTCAMNGTTGCR